MSAYCPSLYPQLLLAAIPLLRAEELLTSEDFRYRGSEDGTAEIIGHHKWSATSLVVPDLDGLAVTSIGDKAFSNHSSLIEITLPNSLTSIRQTFSGCENSNDIVPNSVTSFGDNPFAFCTSLNQIIVRPDHPTLATVDGVLFNSRQMPAVVSCSSGEHSV